MIQIASFTFNPFAENTFVLYDESGEALIIDAGCYHPEEERQLQSFIEKKELKVVKLLNTHCHLDHVFGNEFIKKTFKVACYAHQAEEFNIGLLDKASMMFGIPKQISTHIDNYIAENELITFGNSYLKVLFTPGHSPGHIVFYNEEQKFCINGDVLFRRSIGRTDLPGGNHTQLLSSIKNQLFCLPDDTIIFSGHGERTSIGYEKQHNPFLK
ncbi:MAG: MBL fold metallo-hydrolase [Thermonemataceae bacterium]|nr:MBL fold metallo-hydrolase [Thermonemataceae bacterium]